MLSKEAWSLCENIFSEIIQHPFNAELRNGTLDNKKFEFYLQQDSLYLIDFAKVLAFAAAKAETPDHIIQLLKFSEGAIVAERELHQSYNIKPNNKKSLACFAYTNFLLSIAATGSLVEILAALLPCFWHYQKLGVYIKNNNSNSNPYQRWIDMYSGEAFKDTTENFISLVNEMSKDISIESNLGQNFLNLFRKSSELEVLFWDDAYNFNCKSKNYA